MRLSYQNEWRQLLSAGFTLLTKILFLPAFDDIFKFYIGKYAYQLFCYIESRYKNIIFVFWFIAFIVLDRGIPFNLGILISKLQDDTKKKEDNITGTAPVFFYIHATRLRSHIRDRIKIV